MAAALLMGDDLGENYLLTVIRRCIRPPMEAI
jgi:hypothetical protein